jgi:hypothetical protein
MSDSGGAVWPLIPMTIPAGASAAAAAAGNNATSISSGGIMDRMQDVFLRLPGETSLAKFRTVRRLVGQLVLLAAVVLGAIVFARPGRAAEDELAKLTDAERR